MLSGLRPSAIWLLETCMVALILFLLWHPAFSVATLRPQQNVVAVLVDDSKSMAHRRFLRHPRSGRQGVAQQRPAEERWAKSSRCGFTNSARSRSESSKTDQLTATAPATRIGDTLERVLAESSSLPLGAIVLLSDGADNAGGIDLQTVAAIRRQRIPVHTIGFGREHPDKDVEIADAVVPARALPQSRLTAVVTFKATDCRGSKAKLTRARRRQGAGVAGRHAEKRWPRCRRKPSSSIAATPGRRRSISASSRSPAKRTRRTTKSRAW